MAKKQRENKSAKGREPYGKIVRRTWTSDRFKPLPRRQKALLAYIWSNSHADGSPGLYRLPILTIIDELDNIDIENVSPEEFKAAVDCLKREIEICVEQGWIEYDFEAKVVYCTKWSKFDPPDNFNVACGMLKRALDLPATPLFEEFYKSIQPFLERFGKPLPKGLQERLDQRLAEPLDKGSGNGSPKGLGTPYPQPQPYPYPYPQPQPDPSRGAENSKNATTETAPTAPQEDKEELIKKGQEKLAGLGIKPASDKKPTYGDAVAEMKKYLRKWKDGLDPASGEVAVIRDATEGHIGKMAGKAVQAIHEKGLGIPEIHKGIREPQFYVSVLRQGIGQPKTVTAFYKHLMQMIAPENGDFLHEYCHNAYQELEIANRE